MDSPARQPDPLARHQRASGRERASFHHGRREGARRLSVGQVHTSTVRAKRLRRTLKFGRVEGALGVVARFAPWRSPPTVRAGAAIMMKLGVSWGLAGLGD